MKKYKVLPYVMSSKSSKELARALECKRLNVKRNTYRGYSNDVVINWGSQKWLDGLSRVNHILNNPSSIRNASNKLLSFERFKEYGVPTLDYSSSIEQAKEWIDEGQVVFQRTTHTGHSGNNIVLAHNHDDLIPAPIYTKNFNKEREYRVHIFKDKRVAIQQKRLKNSENREQEPDEYVWNHAKGQRVFVRNSVEITDTMLEEVTDIGINAIKALDLDFGALDVGWNEEEGFKVFEINTGFGLVGSTINDWKQTFKEYLYEIEGRG